MKRVLTVVVVAVLGLVVAGCASGHKAASRVTTVPYARSVVDLSSGRDTIVVSGSAIIPHVKAGTEIACKGGGPKVKVPAGMAEVAGKSYTVGVAAAGHWSSRGSGSVPETSLELLRSPDGTVTVTCGTQ